jgi:16S rRNA (cytosine967-C5)-methyltransferase
VRADAFKPKVKKTADARRTALYALCDVMINGAYAGQALGSRLREFNINPEDRRLATSIFYTALENRLLISHLLGQFIDRMPEPAIVEVLHIAVAQLMFLDRVPDHAAVDEAVKLTRALGRERYIPMINGALRSLIRARDAGALHYPNRDANPARYLSIMHSMTEPIVARLIRAYGIDEAERVISHRPDVRFETIRPNLLRYNAEAFEKFLCDKGWEWRPGLVPMSWQVFRPGDLTDDYAYYQGEFSVLGACSMLAAYAVSPRPGMVILDACAAPGGKAALLCELMQGTGRVYAFDSREHRADLLKATARRLRLYNMRSAVVDSTVFRPDREMAMDAVLVDAPCSGLGVIKDKADIKLRLKDSDIDELAEVQHRLLETCSKYVKTGGLLVYSTCTILPEENEGQIMAFLEKNTDFEPDPGDQWLPERLRHRYSNGMIQLFSHVDPGMEGFFIARLRRARMA